ncbi:MAG: hypothetical protein ACPG6R_11010 [Aequoribacter sp.]|uniref:hypothetical protein n=1 Tax=Aequoribacter sp. TaxID=2847771 RepID=UPI003C45DC61
MSDPARIRTIRGGLHASINDFSADASTIKFIDIEDGSAPNARYNMLDVNVNRGDGLHEKSIRGTKEGDIKFSCALEGLDNGGAGDGDVVASATELNIVNELIESMWGTTGTDGTGDTSAAGSSGATLEMGASTPFAAEQAILFADDVTGHLEARFITGKSGDTLTLNAAPLDADFNAVDPADSSVCYAAATYACKPANAHNTHMYFDAEGSNWRRKFSGVMGNAQLDLSSGQYVKLAYEGSATDWTDSPQADPTFSAPNTGAKIVNADASLVIGGAGYFAHGFSFDFGVQMQPRPSDSGPNNKQGSVVVDVVPSLEFAVQFSSASLTGSATNTILDVWQSNAAQDLLLQVGRSAGSAMAIWMPAADFKIDEFPTVINGLEYIKVRATPSRSSDADVNYECYAAIF